MADVIEIIHDLQLTDSKSKTMKNLFLILAAVILSASCTGTGTSAARQQDTTIADTAVVKNNITKTPITGLGVLKLGQSSIKVAAALNVTVKQCKNDGQFFDRNGSGPVQLFQIQHSLMKSSTYPLVNENRFAAGCTLYALVNYETAGIKMPGIILSFYNDSLVTIDCQNIYKVFDVLNDALGSKYGHPKRDTASLKGDVGDVLSWVDGKNTLLLNQHFYKDEQGRMQQASELLIADNAGYEKLQQLEADKSEEYLKRREEEMKKKHKTI